MDPHVAKLETPEECDQFAANVAENHPELALEAARRGVLLRASRSGAKSEPERAALEAVYAYEAARARQDGKKFRASRTWQMIARHGIIKAVERAVDRPEQTEGYRVLVAMGMQDFAFESVVLRFPAEFSPRVVERCKERLAKYEAE